MNHLLTTLPTFPHISEIEFRYSHIDRDLILHLSNLMNSNVCKEITKFLLWTSVTLSCMSPIICFRDSSRSVSSTVGKEKREEHLQEAPPTGPTLWSFLIQIGTPGQVWFTWASKALIRCCHHSTRAWVRGCSVEVCETRSCRPKNARSQTRKKRKKHRERVKPETTQNRKDEFRKRNSRPECIEMKEGGKGSWDAWG